MILPAYRALQQIRDKKIAPGYLLLGKELYWRDCLWEELRRALGLEGESAGLSEHDLRQASLASVVAVAAERNLWSPRQLLLVRNAQTLSGTKPLEVLAEYFKNPNPGSVLLFEMTDIDLGSQDWREQEKARKRQQDWEAFCEVVLLNTPALKDCLDLIRREAAERGGEIAPPTAEKLLLACDGSLGRVVRELDKLSTFAGTGEITPESVDLLAGHPTAAQGLTLPEAVGTGNPSRLLEAFEALAPKGAYLPLILAEITTYLRQLLLLQQGSFRDSREASRALWGARLPSPPALLPELLRQARAFPPGHLRRCLRDALQTEILLRSSPADDRLVLERFLLEIARPLRKNG